MPLERIDFMLHRARDAGYAVGYFESWSLESLQGVIDAVEESRSPVIIGFNGAFLSAPDRLAHEQLTWYGALGARPPSRRLFLAGSSSMNALMMSGCGGRSPAGSTSSCRPIPKHR